MARILLGGCETSVFERADEVLSRIVASRDGIRNRNDTLVAPPGWVLLTAGDTGDDLYVPTDHIAYVRED
jgi:hypothetical protein